MAFAHRHPPQWLICSRLKYDPGTGIFRWREGALKGGRAWPGSIAGTNSNKYRLIGMRPYGQIGAHRLAWIYVFGDIPYGMEVDHKDCDPANNRLNNLRLATSTQQKHNKRVQSNNKSGLKGAFYHNRHEGKARYATSKNWRSQIKSSDGKLIFLGYFHTPEEAHEAYCKAVVQYHGEFARSA